MSHILVVADLIDHEPLALKAVGELADTYQRPLHIVFFAYETFHYLPEQQQTRLQQQVLEQMEAQAQQLIDQHLISQQSLSFEVVWQQNIADWIQNYVEQKQPELVVKTGNRSESAFHTPTDWQLLRHCPAPVYILAEKKWRRSAHVMACIDLNSKRPSKQALNHRVLQQARTLADARGCELHVCYVAECSPVLQALGMQYTDEVTDSARSKHKARVRELAEQYAIPEANFHIQGGEPDKVIASTAAANKVGTVVVGTVGRGGVGGKVLGNTAEKIFSLLKTDVLALKPE